MIDLSQWIGTYTPIEEDVLAADGVTVITHIVEGMAGMDWTYICRFLVLIMVTSIFLTMLVAVVKKVMGR